MFESIHALRKRSNAFVKDVKLHSADVIEASNKGLVKINQDQLQDSKLATGKSITPLYSNPYAKKKGFEEPDLFVTGGMYNEMDVIVNENDNTYFITSFAAWTKYLIKMYGNDIFGIMPKNISKALKLTIPKLSKLWYRLVVKT